MPAEFLCTQSNITGTLLLYIGAKWLHITVICCSLLSVCQSVCPWFPLHFNTKNLAVNVHIYYIGIYNFMYENVFPNIFLALLKQEWLSMSFHTESLVDLQLFLFLEHFKLWVLKWWQGKQWERRAADCFLKAVWRRQCTDCEGAPSPLC